MLGKSSQPLNIKTEKKILKRRHSLLAEDSSRWSQLMTPFNGTKNQQLISPHVPVQFATQIKNPRTFQLYSKDSSPSNHPTPFGNLQRTRNISEGGLVFQGDSGDFTANHIQTKEPFPLTIRKCSTEKPVDISSLRANHISGQKSHNKESEDQTSSVMSFENNDEVSPKFDINEFAADWSQHLSGSNSQQKKPVFGRSHTLQSSDLNDLNPFNTQQEESREKEYPLSDFQEERLKLAKEKRPVTIVRSNIETKFDKNLASPHNLRDTPDFTRDVQLSSIKLNLNDNITPGIEKTSAEDTPNFENRENLNSSWDGIDLKDKGDLQQQILNIEKADANTRDEKQFQEEFAYDKTKNNWRKEFGPESTSESEVRENSQNKRIKEQGKKDDSQATPVLTDQNMDMSWARVSFDPQEIIKKFNPESQPEEK